MLLLVVYFSVEVLIQSMKDCMVISSFEAGSSVLNATLQFFLVALCIMCASISIDYLRRH